MLNETTSALTHVQELIRRWREEFAKLNSTQQEALTGTLADLTEPCQVVVIWLRNARLGIDRQLWLITHFDDEPDLDIVIGDPLETTEVQSQLSSVIDIPRFRRPLPKPKLFFGVTTYAELVESQALALIEGIRGEILQMVWVGTTMRSFRPVMQHRISDHVVTWIFNDSPDNLDASTLVDQMIQELKTRAEQIENARQARTAPTPVVDNGESSSMRRGFGSYLYPREWIGEKPLISFERRVRTAMFNNPVGLDQSLNAPLVLFKEVGDFHIVAKQDGFIGVTIDDRESALRVLNIFMSLMTASGVPALSMRDNDLQTINVDVVGERIVSTQGPLTLPRMLPSYPSAREPEFEISLREPLSLEKLIELWDGTAAILENQGVAELFWQFGEVYTHFQNEEYSACILFASKWVEQWSQLSESGLGLSGDSQPDRIGARHSIFEAFEWLDKVSEIDLGLGERLRELRQIRNRVLHENDPATRSDAEKALAAVAVLLGNLNL